MDATSIGVAKTCLATDVLQRIIRLFLQLPNTSVGILPRQSMFDRAQWPSVERTWLASLVKMSFLIVDMF